jgi:hypothetical protein
MSSIDRLDRKFVIICDDEGGMALSNERGMKVWKALDDLLLRLLSDTQFADESTLYSWQKEPRHSASAKEPYAWRAALEEIKNTDLTSKCESFREDSEKFIVMTDKPTMLKVAGEITSCLLHSYTSRHKISFVAV